MTPAERAGRAIAAKALLEDPTVQSVLAAIEADFTAEWRRAQTPEERENLWRAMNIMERLKTYLNSYASHDLVALRRSNIPRQ